MFSHHSGIWSHNQAYLELCITVNYTTMPYSEPWFIYNPKASSKVCWTCKMIMHIQTPGIVRTVHSNIFKDMLAYSGINWKRCPDYGKIGLDCVHLSVKVSIQNVFLRVSRRKNSKMFFSFSSDFDKMFTEVL